MEVADFQEYINEEDDSESSVEDEEGDSLEETSAASFGKEEKGLEIGEGLAEDFSKLCQMSDVNTVP